MDETIQKTVKSLTIVSVCAIIAISIICLAALGFNTQITADKEKIEVITANSNSNQIN